MSVRPSQRGNRRRRFAVLALTLSVLAVVWSTQTAAAPHPAAPASTYPEPTGGHDSHGSSGNASPAPGSSPTGTEHDADAHVDLPQGGQEWSTPDLVAQGALVRIETVAGPCLRTGVGRGTRLGLGPGVGPGLGRRTGLGLGPSLGPDAGLDAGPGHRASDPRRRTRIHWPARRTRRP